MTSGRLGFRRAVTRVIPALALWLVAGSAQAQSPALGELLSAVVRIKTLINPDGRTVDNLGRERTGSGVVIDTNGLVLTIGYLMVEAHAAEIATNDGRTIPASIVGYDHETGFGLLQAIVPLKVRPMQLGKSTDVKSGDPVIVAAGGGPGQASAAHVVSKREFAGAWEYLLDEAIFTAPPHPGWSGAALINRAGQLVGVGSLIVGDASGEGRMPGNMFVPIDRLPPILADLMADGRPSGSARPWLGMSTNAMHGGLAVSQVTPGGPADRAGVKRGDVILGVDGETLSDLPAFYRKIWSRGAAGVTVPLDLLHNDEKRRVEVKSMNRLDHLKLKSTF
jgi:serine protease Do